jgi:hypothetical protein
MASSIFAKFDCREGFHQPPRHDVQIMVCPVEKKGPAK